MYDAATNKLIVFGGARFGSSASATTVFFNDVGAITNANGLSGTIGYATVIPQGTAGSPPAREITSAVYDAANSRMILFGGCNASSFFGDTWVLSNANGVGGTPTWIKLAPVGTLPPARCFHTEIYDTVKNRMVIFGGNNNSTVFSDVWVLSNANGLGGTPSWSKLSTSGRPPNDETGASAVYDSTNNIMIVFGGEPACGITTFGCTTNAVWTLSNANGLGGTPTWTDLIPNGSPGSPSTRTGHSAIYDSANNRMTVFGGTTITTSGSFLIRGDVWVLSHANGQGGTPSWAQLSPSALVPPVPRAGHIAAYDSANNRMIIYGGGSTAGNFFDVRALIDANGL